MNIFTKRMVDWTLMDTIKATAGTIGLLYVLDKVYDKVQERKEASDIHYDETDYEQKEDEEVPE